MPKKKSPILAPWQGRSLQHYPTDWWEDGGLNRREPEMKQAEPFEATLRFSGFSRGRSAAYATWTLRDDVAVLFPMFLTDLGELLRCKLVQNGGVVHGFWIPVKRGQNFGLRSVS